MRMESLEYFLKVAHTESISLAARQIYISQQGLSNAIYLLERELGVSLFERSGQRIHLTEAGRRLIPLAERYIACHNEIVEEMQSFAMKEGEGRKIHILATRFVTGTVFKHMASKLDAYGLRDVVVLEWDLEDMESGLRATGDTRLGLVDVLDGALENILPSDDFAFLPLFRTWPVLMASPELVSPRKRSITADEVLKFPIACFKESTMLKLMDALFPDGLLENTVLRTSNTQMLNEYVAKGKAVAFCDSFTAFCRSKTSNLLFIPIEDAPGFTVGFLHTEKDQLAPEALAYINRFRACLDKTCAPYFSRNPTT